MSLLTGSFSMLFCLFSCWNVVISSLTVFIVSLKISSANLGEPSTLCSGGAFCNYMWKKQKNSNFLDLLYITIMIR